MKNSFVAIFLISAITSIEQPVFAQDFNISPLNISWAFRQILEWGMLVYLCLLTLVGLTAINSGEKSKSLIMFPWAFMLMAVIMGLTFQDWSFVLLIDLWLSIFLGAIFPSFSWIKNNYF
jgi:hypothetical protein